MTLRLAAATTAVITSALAAHVLLATPSWAAATYVVDGSDSACDDGASSPGSAATPFCTIGRATKAAVTAGARVQVHAGVYREQVTVGGSGSPGAPVIFDGDPGAVVLGSTLSTGSWQSQGGGVYTRTLTSRTDVVAADGSELREAASASALSTNSWYWDSSAGVLSVRLDGSNPSGHAIEIGQRSSGFKVSSRHDVTITGFTIRYVNGSAVNVSGGSAVTVADLDVASTGSYGIYSTAATGPITVSGCRVTSAGSHGIRVSSATGATIIGNTSHGNDNHGISLQGVRGSLVAQNTSYGNDRPTSRGAAGIDVNQSSIGNVIERNYVYGNDDTGIQLYSGSNDNLVRRNITRDNGDHGFDTLGSTGTVYVNNTSYGNTKDGFSIEGTSTNTTVRNNIAAQNREFDLYVDAESMKGLDADRDLYWNTVVPYPFKLNGTKYASLEPIRDSLAQELTGVLSDPRFSSTTLLTLGSGSPAIDRADSTVSGWSDVDFGGSGARDDSSVPNTGTGSITYGDLGARERQP